MRLANFVFRALKNGAQVAGFTAEEVARHGGKLAVTLAEGVVGEVEVYFALNAADHARIFLQAFRAKAVRRLLRLAAALQKDSGSNRA